jgi:hypothetical protein
MASIRFAEVRALISLADVLDLVVHLNGTRPATTAVAPGSHVLTAIETYLRGC